MLFCVMYFDCVLYILLQLVESIFYSESVHSSFGLDSFKIVQQSLQIMLAVKFNCMCR